jgi:hypothetical protein
MRANKAPIGWESFTRVSISERWILIGPKGALRLRCVMRMGRSSAVFPLRWMLCGLFSFS